MPYKLGRVYDEDKRLLWILHKAPLWGGFWQYASHAVDRIELKRALERRGE